MKVKALLFVLQLPLVLNAFAEEITDERLFVKVLGQLFRILNCMQVLCFIFPRFCVGLR